MRLVAVSFLVSVGLAGASLAACSSDDTPSSPSDPASFDRSMFRESALASFQGDAQPFVMGHAIGVYLLGKTIPPYLVSYKYSYRPGVSAPFIESPYDWEGVLAARSGGDNGNGGAIYDDVGGGTDPGDGDGSDDPGDPFDDVEPCDEIPLIASSCEEFLGAAALRARTLSADVDAHRFAPAGMSGVALEHFADVFEAGMAGALALRSQNESVRNSEVEYIKADAIADHLCEY